VFRLGKGAEEIFGDDEGCGEPAATTVGGGVCTTVWSLSPPRRSPTVPGGVQRDLPAFPACRHRLIADDYRTEMTRRFAVCNEIIGLTAAA
jgi:hypothetical protein